MKVLYTFLLLTISLTIFSQRGKDGTVSITTPGTIVNAYTYLTSDVSSGNNLLSVNNSAAFSIGDLVYIIQMQGASVNAGRDTLFPDVNSAVPTNTTFGEVTNYNSAGRNEFGQVRSVPDGTSIVLDCGLNYAYLAAGKVQVVKVPRYYALTISGAGSITCPQWDGNTGGVVLVEVQTNAVLNNTGSFDVSGKGFRGGAVNTNTVAPYGGNKYGSVIVAQGGYKGESIAGDTTRYKVYSSVFARGAMANGGGGGCSHNSGGGGGANGGAIASYNGYGNPDLSVGTYAAIWNRESANFSLNTSSGGGRGGYSFSSNDVTLNSGSNPPGSTNWGGDSRRPVGGFGGRPLDYSTGRLFLGGGGGAGNGGGGATNQAGAGGNGGGLVYVVCYGDLTGSGTIIANGANGSNSIPGCGSNDAGGGGGGGGTIILRVNGTTNLTAPTALSARGGNGGNVTFNCALNNSTAYGPGAGGGGGYIGVSGTLPGNSLTGGNNGIVTGNSSNIVAQFPPNGATKGGAGSTGTIADNYTLTASPNQTLCTNQAFTVTASSTEPGTTIYWYFNADAGTFPFASGNSYSDPGVPTPTTFTIYAGVCGGTYRQPIVFTVNAGLNMSVSGTNTICPGQSTILTASGATTYTWVSGPATNTISVSPASTTVYTVNGTSGSCSGSQTVNVTVSPTPALSVASTSICAGNTATLTVTSSATSFTWMPGGQTTSSIAVTPTLNTTYTVTGSNGACSNTTTATVSVTSNPTLATSPSTICAGQIATFTVSGATSYTWNPGNVTGSTFTLSPASSTTVSVIGASGTCTAQTTSSLTVTPNPSITVASQTICPGQSTVLTANGATTYTWVSGPTTNTISVSPGATTVYTVNGTTNSCTSSQTATVSVGTVPTIAVSGNTAICSGNSTTLTASGATSYTWASGGQLTSTVSLNPASTTNYTVTGSNGVCSNSIATTVSVTPVPVLTANSVTICPGQTATLTVSGATSYTWMPGNVTGNTYTIAPSSNTFVTVTGANGSCTAQATPSVIISSGISLSVNNPTICTGQSATLTASGATTYTWDSGAQTNTLTVNPASTAVYTVSGTAGTCTGSTTSTVTVIGQPTISITGNTSICSGSSTSLTASGAGSYTWAAGGELTATVSLNPSSTTDYTVTGSNGICSNTSIVTVSVTPTPTLTANSVTICPGQTATLTVSGATTYTWMPANVTGDTYTIAPLSNTVVTVTGANGSCTTQATPSVTIGTGITLGVNNPTICAGQSATLTASGATTYTWDSGAQTNTVNVNPASTTVYAVSGSAGTCTGSTTSTVTVLNLPTLSVTGNTAICSGNSTTLTAGGATSYTWAPGGELTASVSVNPVADITYTVTGFDGACTNTTTVDVSVTPTPTLTANPVTICAGQTATLMVSGANTYTWNPGNVTGDTYVDSPSSSSTYTVIGASGTCTSQVTTSITISPSLSIAVNNPTICVGQSAVLTATSTATSYTWSTGSNSNTSTVFPVTTTVYMVSGSNGSCTGVKIATVTVNPVPTLTVTSNDICAGQTSTLNVSGASTYTWSNGNNNSTQTVNPSTTTVYTVNGTSIDGCTNTAIATTTVMVTAVPVVTANIANICAGQTATLTASGASSYTWSTVEFTGTINPTPVNTTTYSVIGTNGGCNSLPFSTTVTVSQSPTLTINALNTSGCAPLCINFTDVTSASCFTITYNFGDGNTGTTNNPNHCFNISGDYTVTATCTNTLGCSSTYTLPSAIQVITTPVADFTISEGDMVTVGTTVNLTNTSSNALLYGWDYCNGVSTATDITTSYADTGSCCITLLASNATCTNSVTKCITIVNEATITIPNVFTPNGDNRNDIFRFNTVGIKDLSCAIYDRWGLKLFEWSGINGGWDGSVKSAAAPDGTYFYILNYTDQKGESKTEKGFLSLFRD